eukprot:gene31017-41299_t
MDYPCICISLRKASRKMTALYDEALAPAGVNLAQFSLLRNVRRHGPVSLTRLGEITELDRSTLGRNVKVLERMGLVAASDDADHRKAAVALTEAGRATLERDFPDAVFLGAMQGEALAVAYASADVFVFPSRTDTFGLVLLEALASGVPVAAFPVTGPRDVIGDAPVGVLSEDLRQACLGALKLAPQDCLTFAATQSWDISARAFIGNIARVRAEPAVAGTDPKPTHPRFAA